MFAIAIVAEGEVHTCDATAHTFVFASDVWPHILGANLPFHRRRAELPKKFSNTHGST
jgi:hypothetical protein